MINKLIRDIKFYIFGREERFTIVPKGVYTAKCTMRVVDVFNQKHIEQCGDTFFIRFFNENMDRSKAFYGKFIYPHLCKNDIGISMIVAIQKFKDLGSDEYLLKGIIDGKTVIAGTYNGEGLVIIEYDIKEND